MKINTYIKRVISEAQWNTIKEENYANKKREKNKKSKEMKFRKYKK